MPNHLTCSIEGCVKPQFNRSFCAMHWSRVQRHNDPHYKVRASPGDGLTWLRQQLETGSRTTGCWEWPYGKHRQGYGQVEFKERNMPAHVVSLLLDGNLQPEPPNHWALHSCDNTCCVNPSHLRWGTHTENMADMVRRERQARGENNGQSKLTKSQVLAIRSDTRQQRVIAKEYNISQPLVWKIKTGQLWQHI